MKRRFLVTLLAISMLTACGKTNNKVNADVNSSMNDILQVATTPAEPTDAPTVTVDKTDTSEEVTYDCPEAIYPSSEWTPEELLASYRDGTAPWEEAQPEFYQLWSRGYEHRFSISHDWLWIDDVQALPLVEETHDISPDVLVKAYQSGEWDGSKWWSEDYSTYVRLLWDGTLDYHYSCYTYTINGDPLKVAFTGRGEVPAYFAEGNVFSFSSHDASGSNEWADVVIRHYVDLPKGATENMIDLYRLKETGTYVLYADNLSLYDHGELAHRWSLKCDEEAFLALRWDDGTMFICDTNQVQSVQPDASTLHVVLKNVVSTDYGYEGTCYVTVEEDGLWRCYEIFSGEVVSESEIPIREPEVGFDL